VLKYQLRERFAPPAAVEQEAPPVTA
jgi:hypothetical protein